MGQSFSQTPKEKIIVYLLFICEIVQLIFFLLYFSEIIYNFSYIDFVIIIVNFLRVFPKPSCNRKTQKNRVLYNQRIKNKINILWQ